MSWEKEGEGRRGGIGEGRRKERGGVGRGMGRGDGSGKIEKENYDPDHGIVFLTNRALHVIMF